VQQYETLKSSGGFDGISATPTMEGGAYMLVLSEPEMAIFKANQDKINQPSDDSISVTLQSSGNYQLHIPAPMWSMIQMNNSFAGITLSPTPQPTADGSYSVVLTPAEWAIFQQNQAQGSAQPQPASAAPGEGEISVSVDESGFYVLACNLAQYKLLKPSFAGIQVKPTTDKSGMMTFRLTEPQWQQFQKNQAAAAGTPGKVQIPEFKSEVEQVEQEQREIGKLNVEEFALETKTLEKEERTVGKLGKIEFQETAPAETLEKEELKVGKLRKIELGEQKDEAAPATKHPPKRVGKLNNPFAKMESSAPPPKRGVGKIGSRFGSKFGGGSTQNDGGMEITKPDMLATRRTVRGPARRAPTSNPVKNLGQRQDVTKDD